MWLWSCVVAIKRKERLDIDREFPGGIVTAVVQVSAVAGIQSLAQEVPHAMGVVKKKEKKEKKKRLDMECMNK